MIGVADVALRLAARTFVLCIAIALAATDPLGHLWAWVGCVFFYVLLGIILDQRAAGARPSRDLDRKLAANLAEQERVNRLLERIEARIRGSSARGAA